MPFVRQRVSTDEYVDPLSGTLVPAAETTATGVGDPLARVDVAVVNDPARALQVSVAGSVKLPVADSENGLGTGKADVAIGGSIFKALGRTSVLADALFWKYGDPEGIDFANALSYSVGVGQLLGDGRWSALVSLSGFTTGIAGLSPPVQLNLGLLTLVGGAQPGRHHRDRTDGGQHGLLDRRACGWPADREGRTAARPSPSASAAIAAMNVRPRRSTTRGP